MGQGDPTRVNVQMANSSSQRNKSVVVIGAGLVIGAGARNRCAAKGGAFRMRKFCETAAVPFPGDMLVNQETNDLERTETRDDGNGWAGDC